MRKRRELDLAAVLGAQMADVSESDTGRDQIQYIDIDLLDDDPNNFYELTKIDELAANIQMCGLQQPIRVRATENGRYIIVSGHRRRAALRMLVDSGETQYREVACIPERNTDISPAFQELRLIYANSDSRQLTSAQISKQAERVEALLYQLKGEGYNFPGRMRDHVAEACKVSKTKLANLKVIRENLISDFQKPYQKDVLAESTALTLAHMPQEHQQKIFDRLKATGEKIGYFYEYDAKRYGEWLDALDSLTCDKTGGPCTNADRKWEHITGGRYYGGNCASICCAECANLAHCRKACPYLRDKIKKLRADAKEQTAQEAAAKAEKDRPSIEQITAVWQREKTAREKAGKSIRAMCKACDIYYDKSTTDADWLAKENGEKIKKDTNLPFGNWFLLSQRKALCASADLLGVSIDSLLCHTDESGNTDGSIFQTGNPPMPGYYWCITGPLKGGGCLYWWSGKSWQHPGAEFDLNVHVSCWMPCPEIPEEFSWNRQPDEAGTNWTSGQIEKPKLQKGNDKNEKSPSMF